MASETRAAPAAAFIITAGGATVTDSHGTQVEVGVGARLTLTAAERTAIKKQGATLLAADEYEAAMAVPAAPGGEDKKVAALEAAVNAANERAEAVERAAEAIAEQTVTDADRVATDHLADIATRDALIEKVRSVNPELVAAAEQEMARELAEADTADTEAEAAAAAKTDGE